MSECEQLTPLGDWSGAGNSVSAWRLDARGLARAVRQAFVPFLLSRLIIVLVLVVAPLVAQVPQAHWADFTIRLSGSAAANGIHNIALLNDANWYYGIAHNGYEHRHFDVSRQANWAFFPLHPLLWRLASGVTGEWIWTDIILVNLFYLTGLTLLWMLTRKLTESDRLADSSTVFAAFWPASYFMMLPHTEALFFTLVTASFLAACSRRWWLAGLIGLFASATRVNGMFLAPALFMRWIRGERRFGDLLKLIPIVGGLLAFMVYLWSITGDPFAFKHIEVTWGRQLHAPWTVVLDYIADPRAIITPWNPKILHFGVLILALWSIVTCWRRGWWELATFTLLTMLAPLLTGNFQSFTRYMGIAPGVYIALALWAEKRPQLGQAMLAISAMALALLSMLFALGHNIGGA